METSITTSRATSEAKVTSHYWGYRELTADEVSAVAGGYDGNGGPGSDSPDSNNAGGSAGSAESMAAQACRDNNAQLTVGLVQNMTNPGGMALAGAQAYGGWCRGDN